MKAKLLSVQVGLPRAAEWQGRKFQTGIFKHPVAGRVRMRRLNLDGDGQADLTAHGGTDKAVYAYPHEHYPYWRSQLPDGLAGVELPNGAFGENLTTEGLLETNVHIGDRFRIGSAEVMIAQPRMPCYKLAMKFNDAGMTERFLNSRLLGIYLRVTQEGEVGAGDDIVLVHRDESQVSIADIIRLYLDEKPDPDLLERALGLKTLPDNVRSNLSGRT